MASSDSFVIYIRSSVGLKFTVLASSDDDISSLKIKVEAQHLALSPQDGRIFVHDIRIIHESPIMLERLAYSLTDNILSVVCSMVLRGYAHCSLCRGSFPSRLKLVHMYWTYVKTVCTGPSSDSFVIYIRSPSDCNFIVLASSDDDISSLKKKAAVQHLALFPWMGRIVAQAIKIIHEGEVYSLPDNIPLRCLFNGAKGIRLLYMDAMVVPPDSAETCTHVLDLCQNDYFVIYIRSSSDFNFAVLASSDDDISSIKKKAEAQHLALFPHIGRIVSQAIKIMHEGLAYVLPDNIPACCLFHGVKEIHLLFMDAVVVPPDSAETRTHVLDQCQKTQSASSDSFLIYIRSSSDFTFAVLASSDDDISSLKKKAAAQHLALFPQIGRIVAQAIKITHEGKEYSLPDNIPVHCLFDGAKGICLLMDSVMVPLNSAESPTHVLDLFQNASSDSFVIYIKSSSDFNFAVLASFDDDISSIKKKAATQHLALFPQEGRIVSQAIKIIQELHITGPLAYVVPDNIPVRCLFDGANKGIRVLYMAAVTVPLDLAESRTHVLDLCQNGDPSSSRDHSLNQGGNTSCTSEARKRKSTGDNTNFAILLDAASADMEVLDAAHEGNGSYNEKENNMALEKEARKEVGYTRSTTNAGETSSLAPGGSDLRDKGTVTPDNRIKDNADIEVNLGKTKQASQPIRKTTDTEKQMDKSQNNNISLSATDSIAAASSDKKKRHTRKIVLSSPPIPIRENESEIREHASKIGASQVKKRMRKVYNLTKKLGEKFDISRSNMAGSGSSTHTKEVFTSRVGDSSPDFNGKKQQAPGLTCYWPTSLVTAANQLPPKRKH